MPTNFTVVPVDDAEGGSHSSAAAGSTKRSTLGQLFKDQDVDSSPEALTGSLRLFLFPFLKKREEKRFFTNCGEILLEKGTQAFLLVIHLYSKDV